MIEGNVNPMAYLPERRLDASLDELIAAALARHGPGRDAVIPVLSEINATIGYIPLEALGKIRRRINAPEQGLFLADSHLFAIASFYHMFSLQQPGKHTIRYCESAPCHVAGGREMVEALQDFLKIKPGQTTPDNRWTLTPTSCLGICAVGPVFMIDGDVFGNVTPARVRTILFQYR